MEILSKVKRCSFRVDEDEYNVIKYWAEKKGMTLNDFLLECVYNQIKYENRDYDLPTAEIARLNQLQDLIVSLSSNVENLETVVIDGFDSLLNLTRGDNYLLED